MSVRDSIEPVFRHRSTIEREDKKVLLICINIGRLSRPLQLLILSSGVFGFHVLSSYFMEKVFRLPGIRPHAWFFVLVQFAMLSVIGFVESKLLRRDGPRRIPLSNYFKFGLFYLAGFGLGNAALAYINYPTHVIFKSCKLIPVLIGGIIIQGKPFSLHQFAAATLMSVGLAFFMLADSQVTPHFSLTGCIMISLSLVGDALLGNFQEKSLKTYEASSSEMIAYSQLFAVVYVFLWLVSTGNLAASTEFFNKHADATYGGIAICSVFGYAGLNIVLTLVKTFGAFAAATVTTMRKAVTITLSFLIFPKPFTFQYVWSGAIVFAGIVLYDLGKQGVGKMFRRCYAAFCHCLQRPQPRQPLYLEEVEVKQQQRLPKSMQA